MDIKGDFYRFSRLYKRAITALLITVFLFCSVFACSGVRTLIRRQKIENSEPRWSEGDIYYNHLPARQQLLYDAVSEAVEDLTLNTKTLPYYFSEDELNTVLIFLMADHPEYFYLNSARCVLKNGWNCSGVRLSYYGNAESVSAMREEYSRTLNEAYDAVGRKATEYQTALALHDYLITRSSAAEGSGICDTAYGPLVNRNGSSLGYAQAYQALLKRFGMECYTVFGKAGQSSVAWNLMKTDGSYYHTDVLSDDPDWEESVLFHGFFGLDDAEMLAYRTLTYEGIHPAADAPSSYYAQNGLEAGTVSQMRAVLTEQLKAQAALGGRFIELRISFSNDIRLFEDMIGEAISSANRSGLPVTIRDTFRVFTSTATNGAATIEIFYIDTPKAE